MDGACALSIATKIFLLCLLKSFKLSITLSASNILSLEPSKKRPHIFLGDTHKLAH